MKSIKKFNFDIFHPLDHWPWEKRCFEFYGGPRVHLQYWWEYKFQMSYVDGWREKYYLRFKCPYGNHYWAEYWKKDMDLHLPGIVSCQYCGIKK